MFRFTLDQCLLCLQEVIDMLILWGTNSYGRAGDRSRLALDEDDEFSSSSNSYSSKQRSSSRRKSDRDFNESERIYFEAEREAFEKIKQDFFSNRFTLEHLSLKPGESINKELILENKTLRILKEQLTKQRDEVILHFSKSFQKMYNGKTYEILRKYHFL